MNKKTRFCVSLLCAGIMGMAGFAPAPASADSLKIEVSRPGDADMSCEQLWKEAFLMRSIIAQTREDQTDSKIQTRGIGVIGTAASYLAGTVTGGLSIAAAGFLAGEASKEKGDDAETLQESAQQRRALLAGIFMAKNCQGPIEEAMQEQRIRPDVPQQRYAEIAPAAGQGTVNGADDNAGFNQ